MAEQKFLPNQELLTEIDTNDDDLYIRMKKLERELELMEIQESVLREEIPELKKELLRTQEELKRFTITPLIIANLVEVVDEKHCIVDWEGCQRYVRLLSNVDHELLVPSAYVCVSPLSYVVVEVLPASYISEVSPLSHDKKPDVTFNDIAGYEIQKQELLEVVDLSLNHPELFRQIGIDPPNGVLLSGPPGTGKTMFSQAVAHQTNATFIALVGSEFATQYLGDGPRMVRDVFRVARENAPAIIFIDEVDRIATARSDAKDVGDREIQRCLSELLTQMDGFDETVNVKVIMATNRADTLDAALLRPGRIDRVIEFPLPGIREKRLIFQTITVKMNLSDEVDLEDFVSRPDKISPAEIAAICQEAGMLAIRKFRYVILASDFEKAYKHIVKRPDNDFEFSLRKLYRLQIFSLHSLLWFLISQSDSRILTGCSVESRNDLLSCYLLVHIRTVGFAENLIHLS